MKPDEMLQWIRDNWAGLKRTGALEEAIEKWMIHDGSDTWSVKDIIDMEESLDRPRGTFLDWS